jgi:putative DNA primase/helicase
MNSSDKNLEAAEAKCKKRPEEQFRECCNLDHSDTDNGKRLIVYFGEDLLVRRESGVTTGAWLYWNDRYWDADNGAAGAALIAQKVGPLIMEEARYIRPTDSEVEMIDAGNAAARETREINGRACGENKGDQHEARLAELADIEREGKAASDAVRARRRGRRNHGLATKNRARMKAMLECAAPHMRVAADEFNPDPLKVATLFHTLSFVEEPDRECRLPAARRGKWRVQADPGHRRADMVTALVPVEYHPNAMCPKWHANLERFQPDPDQRRTVQQFTGLGLLGKPIQRVMFHYGSGGNFKSVFLETVTRVLGDSFAVGLPTESLIGGRGAEGSAGGPRPDLERVFGKRMLRVLELPSGAQLKADLIKKLTGGERWPIRTLYKSFYEFTPCAKTHMSGNDYPKFDGSDGGMQRRLLVVEWPIKIPESEQRDFDLVVAELLKEAPGILNWLIDGAIDYLEHGLVVSAATRATTADYFEEMDPVARFVRDCVSEAQGQTVGAREMFNAYRAYCAATARNPVFETRFGLTMKKKFKKDDRNGRHFYCDVRLHDVPTVNDEQNPRPHGESRDQRQGDDFVPA